MAKAKETVTAPPQEGQAGEPQVSGEQPAAPPEAEPAPGEADIVAASIDDDRLPAGPAGYVIKVRGPEDGRWRAGIKFGPIEVEIDLSTITRAQAREIAADSYLTVRRG